MEHLCRSKEPQLALSRSESACRLRRNRSGLPRLVDSYQEDCRPDSDATLMRVIRTVEQGMGRSVRGEKDYSAIIVTGADLTKLLRDPHSRTYLSC